MLFYQFDNKSEINLLIFEKKIFSFNMEGETIVMEEVNRKHNSSRNELIDLNDEKLPLYTELYPKSIIISDDDQNNFSLPKILLTTLLYVYNIIFVCISISTLYIGILNINNSCSNKLNSYLIVLGISSYLYKMLNILFYCDCFGCYNKFSASLQVVTALTSVLLSIFIVSDREVKNDCSDSDLDTVYIYSQQLSLLMFLIYTAEFCYHGCKNFKNIL